ncbi:MAG: hypothetical protein WCH57_01885 [Verrucomicrobiota bacterium]
MIESEFPERPYSPDGRRTVLRLEAQSARLSPAQANALARLIQTQMDAYAEAVGSPPQRRAAAPLTGRDLDLLEPLVPLFRAMAHPRSRKIPKL